MKIKLALGLIFFCMFAVTAPAKPIYKDWQEYSKAIQSAQGNLPTTESAQRAIKLCEAVLASPEETAEIRICAKLKIASVIIPGVCNFKIFPGPPDLPRALKLIEEVMNETSNNHDRQMCLSLRSRALAWQGKKPEAEAALAQLEQLATALPNAEGDLWGWAMASNDVFTVEGKTDTERIAWFLARARKEPQTMLGQNCAAFVGNMAVSTAVKETDVEAALGMLKKYHPNSENTHLVEKHWQQILQERDRRARVAALEPARTAASRAPAPFTTGDPKLLEVKNYLAREFPGILIPNDATLGKMLSQIKAPPRNLAVALGAYWADQNKFPNQVQALTSPIAYLSPSSLAVEHPNDSH